MRILWVVVVAGACGTSRPEVGPDAPADVAAPMPDAQLFALDGTVVDTQGNLLPNAQVCVLHHTEIPCSTTDGAGKFLIEAPALVGPIAFRATAQGYLGSVRLALEHAGGLLWPGTMILYSDAAAMQRFGTAAGFTVPTSGTGIVEVRIEGATAGSLTGATATLAPTSSAAPVYDDAQHNPVVALTSSTTSGGVLFGNLAPGGYSITATASQKTCTVTAGGNVIAGDWPPVIIGTGDFEIAADSLTDQIHINCI